MRFDVLTLFPELLEPFRRTGVLGRAVEAGRMHIAVHDLREWAGNRWGQVDDEPYGGGAGMVIMAPPVLTAVRDIAGDTDPLPCTVLLSPRGRPFDHETAVKLARQERLILLCGRYEGFDERVREILRPDELSIGDFILGGGEVAAMAVIETTARLLPGVVGDPDSVAADSFADGLLDYPSYTRPADVEGLGVPEILTSGHHEAIRRWRLERAVEATVSRRPDLIRKNWHRFSVEVRDLVRRLAPDLGQTDSD